MAGISAILIAAGESTRMGRPKSLIAWQGKTLLEYQIEVLIQAGSTEVIVVLGHGAGAIIPYVRGPGVKSVINSQYRLGKITSIRIGLKAIDRQAEGILLLAVDQPRPQSIVRRLIQEHISSGYAITAPRYQGHGGHPCIFSVSLRSELEAISEQTEGIREVIEKGKAHGQINWIDVETPLVRLDINDHLDYEQAKRIFLD